MNIDKNEPAFPRDHRYDGHNGLSKREYFAAIAMQGLLSNTIYHNSNEKHRMISLPALCETATMYADGLLNELEKNKVNTCNRP